jgi:hypothetical protein
VKFTAPNVRTRLFFAACLALLMCGCHHTGDFSAFFVQQVSQYGGHTRTTNAIPALHGTWSVKSDDEGFQAHLSGVSFADVQSFLQQVYGNPVIKTADIDGRRHGVYGARDIGVAIQFFDETNGIGFVCVRGQKWPFWPKRRQFLTFQHLMIFIHRGTPAGGWLGSRRPPRFIS